MIFSENFLSVEIFLNFLSVEIFLEWKWALKTSKEHEKLRAAGEVKKRV